MTKGRLRDIPWPALLLSGAWLGVADDGLPHLRNSLGRDQRLRIAEVAPPLQRQIEGASGLLCRTTAAPGLTFWQFTLRAVPVVVAIVSTAVLAYFLLSERSQPFAQLQQAPQPGGGRGGADGAGPARADRRKRSSRESGRHSRSKPRFQPVRRLGLPRHADRRQADHADQFLADRAQPGECDGELHCLARDGGARLPAGQ